MIIYDNLSVQYLNRWLPLTSLVIYMIGFSIGFGCIPFLLLGELFPVNERSVLSSIAGSFNLGVMFIVIKTYHYLEAVRVQCTLHIEIRFAIS